MAYVMTENVLPQKKPSFRKFLKDNWFTIAVLVYLVSPIDLIPEGIFPVIGSVDDAVAALIGVLTLWRESQKIE